MGPYSLEGARALVLNGQVLPVDWAIYDGAADWVPLNQVPGFVQAPPTVATPTPVQASEEVVIWSGSPSQWLNVSMYIKWALFFGFFAVVGAILGAIPDVYALAVIPIAVMIGFLPVCILSVIYRILKLKRTRYVISNQRVKIVRGILSKEVEEVELFRVKDTAARQTFLLRLVGLGNVVLLSADKVTPTLYLQAIPQPMQIREQLREEIIALRRKFGVREMELM